MFVRLSAAIAAMMFLNGDPLLFQQGGAEEPLADRPEDLPRAPATCAGHVAAASLTLPPDAIKKLDAADRGDS